MPQVLSNLLGSRKDIAMVIIIGVSACALFTGRISSVEFESLVKWIGGGWLGARGLEDAMTKSAALKSSGTDDCSADD